MDNKNYCDMSNSELKLSLITLENEYESKKAEILRILEEMKNIEIKYSNINNELNSRKNLFV